MLAQKFIVKQELHERKITLGRMACPFEVIPFPTLWLSPVVIVHKKEGDVRLIHHLSIPDVGSSIYFTDQ